MSDIRLLLDENLTPRYRTAVLRREPQLIIWHVGLPGAPAKGTPDPIILAWCEINNFVLVTNNRKSMPVHLEAHLANGQHVPGILVVGPHMTIGEIVDELLLIVHAALADEFQDQIIYLPITRPLWFGDDLSCAMIDLAPAAIANKWVVYRQRRLPEQLRRLVQFVHECQSEPERARPHFQTIRKHLKAAQNEPDCRPLLAELVLALHPWPKWWGYWEEWLVVCNQAAVIVAELGQYQAQGWLLADVIEMLFELGRHDEAKSVWQQLWAVANVQMTRPLCRAGHTTSTKLILSGQGDVGTAVYEQQVEWLARWQPEFPLTDYWYAHTLVVLQQTLVMRRQGTQHDALALIDALLERLESWADAPADLWRDTYHHQGGLLSSIARYDGSIVAMEKAIAWARRMGDDYYEAALYSDKAIPLWAAGYFDEVETAARRSIYLCEKLRVNWRLVRSIKILLDVLIMRPALEEALIWLPRQIELTQQLNDEATLSDAHTIRALVYMQQEKYDLALADLQFSEASCLKRATYAGWAGWKQI